MNTATRILLQEKKREKRNAKEKLNRVRKQVKEDARKRSRQRLRYHRKTLNWTLDTIIQVIRDKILGRIRRAEETYVVAFKMLECPMQGINRQHLRDVMKRRFGLVLTKDEVNMLFERYDTDRSDLLDFNEFVRVILPPDYVETPPLTKNALEMTRKKTPFKPDQPIFHRAFDGAFRPSVVEIERQLREKILARTRDPSSQYRMAFQMFGRTNRITKNRFNNVCKKWGIHLKQVELDTLFSKYDTDNSGYLEFNELIFNVLPKDFPQRGPWYYARAKGIERQKLAKRYGVPVNLLEKHLERKGMLTRQEERERNLKRFAGAKDAHGKIRLKDSLSSANGIDATKNPSGGINDSILNPFEWDFHGSSSNNSKDFNEAIEQAPGFDRLLRTAQSAGTLKKKQEQVKKLLHTKDKDPFIWKYRDHREELACTIRNMRPGGNYKSWKRPQTTYEHIRPNLRTKSSVRGDRMPDNSMVFGKSMQISPIKSASKTFGVTANKFRPKTVNSEKTNLGSWSSRPLSTSDSYSKGYNDAFNTILNVATTNDQERRQYSHLMKTASKPFLNFTNRYKIC